MVVGLTNLINGIRRNIDRRKAARAEKWIQLHQPANHEIETLVYAHRGSKCNRPENTLASFNEAIRIGTDGIELDVHLTADNQLVVIHDEKKLTGLQMAKDWFKN